MSKHDQYRFIPAKPMSEEEADYYIADLEEFHCLEAERMRREDEQAKRNVELAMDLFRACKYGTKQ